MPPPLKASHDGMLMRFRRKRKSMVVGHQRLLFAQTRDGSVMPIWLVVRESPPDREDAEPRFTATLDPVNTSEAFLFVGDTASNFRVYAASSRALDLLGLEGEMLMEEHVSAVNFFPTVAQEYTGGDLRLTKAELQAISRQSGASDLRDLLRRRKETDGSTQGAGRIGRLEKKQQKQAGSPHTVAVKTATEGKGSASGHANSSLDASNTAKGSAVGLLAAGSSDIDDRIPVGTAQQPEGLAAAKQPSFTNLVAAMEEAKAIRS